MNTTARKARRITRNAASVAALCRAGALLAVIPYFLLIVDSTAVPPAKLPPTWFKHAFWRVHRALTRLSGGRFLWKSKGARGWGALQLTTVGRKTGRERTAILGYIEDGPNLVALAMNGWDPGHPGWWLNLVDQPDVVVRLAGQRPRPVLGRAATGEERERLWRRWGEIDVGLDAYAMGRSTETPVVVFEPRAAVNS